MRLNAIWLNLKQSVSYKLGNPEKMKIDMPRHFLLLCFLIMNFSETYKIEKIKNIAKTTQSVEFTITFALPTALKLRGIEKIMRRFSISIIFKSPLSMCN